MNAIPRPPSWDALCSGWLAPLGAVAALERGDTAARVEATRLGRRAASAALATLGAPALAVGDRQADGRPRWPDGTTGSISHSAGLVVAVVAPSARVQALGVDVEQVDGLGLDDAAFVLDDAELAAAARSTRGGACGATLRWSAKEAAYKAWCELLGGAVPPVDPQADLHVEAGEDGSLHVRAAGPLGAAVVASGPAGQSLRGRWCELPGAVTTVLAQLRGIH